MMKMTVIVVCLFGCASTSSVAMAAGPKSFKKALDGYDEVPAVSTAATGFFKAKISKDETRIEWELRYADLEGAVQQAHIHIGNRGLDGGISVFLCTNLGNGPAGTQPCPAPPATISGVLVAADVSPNIPATVGARSQGLDTGEIDELIRATRAGVTYVDVHSTRWPGGEIRAQLGRRK